MSGSNSCKSCWSVFDAELKLCPQCGADLVPEDQSANIPKTTVSKNVNQDVKMTIRRPEVSSIINQNLSEVRDAKNEEFLDQKNIKTEDPSSTNSTMDLFNSLGLPSLSEIAISNETYIQPNSSHFEPSKRNGAEMQSTGNPYGHQNFQNPNTPFSSYPRDYGNSIGWAIVSILLWLVVVCWSYGVGKAINFEFNHAVGPGYAQDYGPISRWWLAVLAVGAGVGAIYCLVKTLTE